MKTTASSFNGKMAVISIISFCLMAYIDYVTGYELIFSAAYLIPVAICAWYFEMRAVTIMSIASGIASWVMDYGHTYSHSLLQYWNSFMCLVITFVTGLLLNRLKHTLAERKKANTELQQALDDLRASTGEIRKLQSGLQVVCAWTKQIKVGDKWMTPDEFLSTQLHLKISHGMSPEAGRDFQEQLKRHAAEYLGESQPAKK